MVAKCWTGICMNFKPVIRSIILKDRYLMINVESKRTHSIGRYLSHYNSVQILTSESAPRSAPGQTNVTNS